MVDTKTSTQPAETLDETSKKSLLNEQAVVAVFVLACLGIENPTTKEIQTLINYRRGVLDEHALED